MTRHTGRPPTGPRQPRPRHLIDRLAEGLLLALLAGLILAIAATTVPSPNTPQPTHTPKTWR